MPAVHFVTFVTCAVKNAGKDIFEQESSILVVPKNIHSYENVFP